MRRNDRETSKYNNQQGIHNHWTCQCNASGSFHLRGGEVATAQWEAAIVPWRRLHFRNCLPLPILLSVRKNRSGICLCCQVVAAWTTTWMSMAKTRWTSDTAGVTTFWRYQHGTVVLSILANFWRVGHHRQEEGTEVRCRCKIGHHQRRHRHCRERFQNQSSEGGIWRQYYHSAK